MRHRKNHLKFARSWPWLSGDAAKAQQESHTKPQTALHLQYLRLKRYIENQIRTRLNRPQLKSSFAPCASLLHNAFLSLQWRAARLFLKVLILQNFMARHAHTHTQTQTHRETQQHPHSRARSRAQTQSRISTHSHTHQRHRQAFGSVGIPCDGLAPVLRQSPAMRHRDAQSMSSDVKRVFRLWIEVSMAMRGAKENDCSSCSGRKQALARLRPARRVGDAATSVPSAWPSTVMPPLGAFVPNFLRCYCSVAAGPGTNEGGALRLCYQCCPPRAPRTAHREVR